MANDVKITIKADNKASKDIKEVGKDLDGLGDSTKGAGKQSGNFADNWSTMLLGINQGIQILQMAGRAVKQVYDAASEGAQLEYAERRFDRLSESIGTTADVLMNDLRNATQGMYSDAELMASAGDFMALGLAKTHDEAVRLASVAGALNMNMNQLVLTLTNQTKMRFDALGVSVDGFDEKVKALEATGLSAEEAFNEAFLQQAEEQIEKVGSAADTAQGDFMRLEAAVKNTGDAFKKNLAREAEPVIEWLADGLDETARYQRALNEALEIGVIDMGEFRDIQADVHYGRQNMVDVTNDLNFEMRQAAPLTADSAEALFHWGDGARDAADAGSDLTDVTKDVEDATRNAEDSMRRYTDALLFKIASEGLTEDQAYLLADSMGLIDERTEYAIDTIDIWRGKLEDGTLTLDEYNARVAFLKEQLGLIDDASATITLTWNEVGGPSGAAANVLRGGGGQHKRIELRQAAGGTVFAPAAAGAYVVGELGPEPFFPAQDGRIISNSEATAALRSGSGGRPVNVNVTINTPMNFADRVWVENELAPYIRDAIARANL